MTPPVEQPSIFTHRNHYLFADYYLDRRVGDQREWQEANVGPVFAAVTQLWRRFKPQGDNEAQTEADWIRPVLSALGHRFNVQVGMKTPLGTKVPDYVFYGDEATRVAAKGDVLTEDDFRDALAVGDAKAWERSLDRAALRDAKTLHENPSLQIDTYIRHSGLAWGILTNGRLWRLYHKDTAKKLDVYYEVDLPALIAQGDAEAFKYFWLFFRREAFIGDAQTPAWLDRVLAESQAYEQGVSANLKEQVYDALRCLAQGFLDYPYNGLTPTPETLRAIHDNSLIVLYRLLFMLYAEARDLLPVRENRLYAENYSLHALKQRVARDLERGLPAVASMSGIWQQLYEQWQVINTGEAALGVPAYNGGLFRPENHPFIERYRVGDLYLRQAIDLLARAADPATGQREFVDYRDLEIRHLGSIYEGLLEYQVEIADCGLQIADSPTVVLVSAAGRQDASNRQSQISNRKSNERKATGSYYTPDYIVQYIVEQTVGPLLEARTATFRPRGGQISDEAGLVKAVLGVNILDPAMGSGHFLVAATDFVARHLVGLGLTTISGSDGEGELAYWRRRVAQSCIYGVDLNPLAVELAKLGLWLATVSKDKPLSFLDHHLRCGNSLIGARVADLSLGANQVEQRVQERRAAYKVRQAARKEEAAREAGQLTMLDDSAFAGAMHTASGMMTLIEELGSETLADVHRAEQVYRESVRAVTEQARLLADIWTARHFGLALDDTIWGGLVRCVLHGGFEMPRYKAIIEQARGIAGERHFLHWELEFPEVFFDGYGRLAEDGGFEVVIGNPPYFNVDITWGKQSQDAEYLKAEFPEVWMGKSDIYYYFVSQGLNLLRDAGLLAFILSRYFLEAHYASKLRAHLLANSRLLALADFGNFTVFEGLGIKSAVIIAQKRSDEAASPSGDFRLLRFDDDNSRDAVVARLLSAAARNAQPLVNHRQLTSAPWNTSGLVTMDLTARIDANCVQLGELCFVGEGMQTGANEVFVVEREALRQLNVEPRHTRKLLKNQDIKRYQIDFRDLWLIYPDDLAQLADSPGLERYLTAHRDKLTARAAYRRGDCEWFRFTWPLHKQKYHQPKLVVPFIAPENRFALDAGAEYIGLTDTYAIFLNEDAQLDIRFLLAVLNSSLLNYRYHLIAKPKDYRYEYFENGLRKIPIRRIAFTTPAETRAALADEAKQLAVAAIAHDAPAPTLAFVAAQLAVQPERSDVIHDLLAHLAAQMIALNEQRQAEMQSFLGWLGRESGARLDALTGKARLQNYLGNYQRDESCLEFDDLLGMLKNNQRKLTVDPTRRAFQDRLHAEYAASLAVLLPIKHRLVATDRLIDRVVYALYGLTEDEIAIVEGRAAATG